MEARKRREINTLLIRLADGDRGAFDPLFDELWPFLRSFARRLLPDEADADDAAQEALLRVFARAQEFDSSRDAVPWVVAITANECRTLRNRRARRREDDLGATGSPPAAEHSATCDTDLRELEAAAVALMGELSPEDSNTLRAAWFGEPRPDVAATTLRKRVQRATERLRALWRTHHGTL